MNANVSLLNCLCCESAMKHGNKGSLDGVGGSGME